MSSTANMQKKHNIFSSLAAHAKAHHESLNAAYQTYYSGGVSPRTSFEAQHEAQRKNSTTSNASTHSESNVNKAWQSMKKHAKEHHEGVEATFAAMYSPGVSTPAESSRKNSAVEPASPRHSTESQRSETSVKSEKNGNKWVKKMKKMAKEHHQGVTAAHLTMWGGPL